MSIYKHTSTSSANITIWLTNTQLIMHIIYIIKAISNASNIIFLYIIFHQQITLVSSEETRVNMIKKKKNYIYIKVHY